MDVLVAERRRFLDMLNDCNDPDAVRSLLRAAKRQAGIHSLYAGRNPQGRMLLPVGRDFVAFIDNAAMSRIIQLGTDSFDPDELERI